MQNLLRISLPRTLDWLLVPLFHPEYRRLMFRCYLLSARLEVLCTVFAVLSPIATPGMLLVMRRWFDRLASDVADFKRVMRMPRATALVRPLPKGNDGSALPFQNPWT